MTTLRLKFEFGKDEDPIMGIMARRTLAERYGVSEACLEHIGNNLCDFEHGEAWLIQYNLICKGHCKHKSTVAFEWGYCSLDW